MSLVHIPGHANQGEGLLVREAGECLLAGQITVDHRLRLHHGRREMEGEHRIDGRQLVIIVPLILPVAVGYGIHPVHLGIIFLANMQIGYFTPPIGMNLFIASYRFDKPLHELYLASWPFMVVLLIALALITYVPWISLVFVQ